MQIRLRYKSELIKKGEEAHEYASVRVHFYDENRKEFDHQIIGPFTGTQGWTTITKTIPVPPKAREMIFRMGLNGATGKLWMDDLSVIPKPR